MVSAAEVRTRLGEILPTIDLDVTTERQIRDRLAKEMGDIGNHTSLIKNYIEGFLAKTAAAEEVENTPPAKRSKGTVTTEGEYTVSLGGTKVLRAHSFKGRMYVDIREFYTDKASGEERPGKNGISLNVDQWYALKTGLPGLKRGLEDGDASVIVELGQLKRAYASEYKGKWSVHVREMYESGGQVLPGKKGITLDASMIQAIMDNMGEVSEHVGGPTGGTSAVKPASQATAFTAGAAAQAAANATYVDLGQDRRLTISDFKGRQYVDLREWYVASGEHKPGKKGISLSIPEWHKVMGAADSIAQALARKDARFFIDLGNKRRVFMSEFKGKMYVGIREFYEKDGDMHPGQKGLNLSEGQWQQLLIGSSTVESWISRSP